MNYQQLKENQTMQKLILILLILFISVSCGMEQSTTSHENVDATILALEREALDQWAQGNPLGFAVNVSDDVTYFDDIGAHNRIDGAKETKNYLASLEGKIPPHNYEIVDPKVQVYGDVAILTFQYHTTIDTLQGPPWKATSVYHFNDSIWQVVHANWSLVKVQ